MDLGKVILGLAGLALGYQTLSKGALNLHHGLKTPSGGLKGTSGRRRARVERDPGPGAYKGRKLGQISTRAGRSTVYEVRTLDDRIAAIREQANKGKIDPSVIAWARRQVSARCAGTPGGWCIPEKNKRKEAEAIFRGMRRDVRYVNDVLGIDTYTHPKRTLEHRAGDCDDYSSLGCASLMAIGIPCQLEVIRTKDSPSWNHIFINAVVDESGSTFSLDASVPVKPGWRVPDSAVAERRVFEVRPF